MKMGEKYVVVKSSDLVWRGRSPNMFAIIGQRHVIDDAVVIRRQDAFAGPALWAYANSISQVAMITVDASRETNGPVAKALVDKAKVLQDIADYFAEQATIADNVGGRLPD